MKAITEYTPGEYQVMLGVYNTLRSKISGYHTIELLDNLQRKFGYAHYIFSGHITDKLVELLGREPTATEVIMLVDVGFSNFGAQCTITGRNFSGIVYID